MTAAPLPLPPAGFRAGTRGPSLVPPPPRRAELALEPRPRLRDGLDSEPRPSLSSRVPALGRGSRGRGRSGAGPSGSSGKFPCGRASPGARPGPASPPAEPLGLFCPRDGPSRCRAGLGRALPSPRCRGSDPGLCSTSRVGCGGDVGLSSWRPRKNPPVPARQRGPGPAAPWLNFDRAEAVAEVGVYLPDSHETLGWGRPGCFATAADSGGLKPDRALMWPYLGLRESPRNLLREAPRGRRARGSGWGLFSP